MIRYCNWTPISFYQERVGNNVFTWYPHNQTLYIVYDVKPNDYYLVGKKYKTIKFVPKTPNLTDVIDLSKQTWYDQYVELLKQPQKDDK